MSFLSYLGFGKTVEEGVKALEPVSPKSYVNPKQRKPQVEQKEYYRVGRTETGMTTLTLLMDGGYSTTLSMNKSACEQLIRMLRASYDIEETTPDAENDEMIG